MKRVKTRSTAPYREVRVYELDRVHGGTVVVTDPGPGDGKGPKVTGGAEATVPNGNVPWPDPPPVVVPPL